MNKNIEKLVKNKFSLIFGLMYFISLSAHSMCSAEQRNLDRARSVQNKWASYMKIGATIGSAVGSYYGPIGGIVGGLLGGSVPGSVSEATYQRVRQRERELSNCITRHSNEEWIREQEREAQKVREVSESFSIFATGLVKTESNRIVEKIGKEIQAMLEKDFLDVDLSDPEVQKRFEEEIVKIKRKYF